MTAERRTPPGGRGPARGLQSGIDRHPAPSSEALKVCVLMPALDEADALPSALAGRPAGVEVVVIDNGSTDGTGAVAEALGARVICEPRRGFGAACVAGLCAAEGADIVVYMDADATLSWADLPAVLAPLIDRDADLVLGRRVRALRQRGAMRWHVAVANGLLGWLCSRSSGVRIHDISPYRAMRRTTLLDLDLADRSYGWPLEMVLRAGRAGLRVTEVPVVYRTRVGTSKVTGRLWPTVRATIRMARVLAQHARAGRGTDDRHHERHGPGP
jgi:glycosyltransferase involved in cell wall biosynthesis